MEKLILQIGQYLADEKSEGKGRVGIFCPYSVEEITDSAGFVPVRLIPKYPTIGIADAYLPSNLCSYLRHIVDLGLKGELEELRCIVFNHSCDGSRRAYEVCKSYLGTVPSFFIDIPKKNDSLSIRYLYGELRKFRDFLEELSSVSLTDAILVESIERYNKNRQLLRELYSLRGNGASYLNAQRMVRILDANVSLSKGRANALLRSICDKIKSGALGVDGLTKRKRVFVSGNIYDYGTLLNIVEECGGWVVGDDFCFGGRYGQIKISGNGDPLYALAEGYLTKVPCGRMENYEERLDFIIEEITKCDARGLVYSSLKFCDNFLVDYPLLKEKLDRLGIPSLFLEGEYFSLGTGQIRTRIEAFLEML